MQLFLGGFKMINFELIESLREKQGFTVIQICEKLDINKSTYSRWVNYKVDPAATKLKKLCDILGVRIDKVFK